MRRRWALVAASVAIVFPFAGCTGDGGDTIASAGDTPAPTASAGEDDPLAHELRFVACMRQEGIADMPDPVPGDASGRSSVRYALDVLGKGSDMVFQAALDKCMSLLPAPPPEEPPTQQEASQQLAFAQCMRAEGVTQFPDPDPEPGRARGFVFVYPNGPQPIAEAQKLDGVVVLNLGDPTIKAALEKCGAPLDGSSQWGTE